MDMGRGLTRKQRGFTYQYDCPPSRETVCRVEHLFTVMGRGIGGTIRLCAAPFMQVGLHNLLWRYYSWPAMAEARKLLGGAGPAIAAVPASLLWAGISIVEVGGGLHTADPLHTRFFAHLIYHTPVISTNQIDHSKTSTAALVDLVW